MRAVAARRPLATFFLLAFAFTWALLPIARSSIAISLLALCGPAAAALLTASLGGREQLGELLARALRWRVPFGWYVVALALPVAVSAVRTALESVLIGGSAVRFQPVTGLSVAVFVLVAGEEIGWRGFALPRLLRRHGPWASSVILGTLWAAWHFPLFYIAGMPQHGTPFVPYVGYLVALSLLLTFLAAHTAGSVVIATLFHGAVNTFGLTTGAADGDVRGWTNFLSYGLIALPVALVAFRRTARSRDIFTEPSRGSAHG